MAKIELPEVDFPRRRRSLYVLVRILLGKPKITQQKFETRKKQYARRHGSFIYAQACAHVRTYIAWAHNHPRKILLCSDRTEQALITRRTIMTTGQNYIRAEPSMTICVPFRLGKRDTYAAKITQMPQGNNNY